MYLLLFLVGLIGFGAMVALGALHSGTTHHHDSGAAHDPGLGEAFHVPHSVEASHPRVHLPKAGPRHGSDRPWFWISPLDVFSFSLGGGATGLLLFGHLPEPFRAGVAVLGALVLNYLLIRPLIRVLGGFASKESAGLEGMLAQPAEAVTSFDPKGRGLVKLVLDGENVQLLATLDSYEMERGSTVKAGERLLVVDVDATRNTCRVIREQA